MASNLQRVRIRNYRSLADVEVDTGNVCVFFGPNGSGKSTFLDALWFVRDCAVRGVELASATRSHGIGILYDSAAEDDQRIEISLSTDDVTYDLQFDLASGKINSNPGEHLTSLQSGRDLIVRQVGKDQAVLYHDAVQQSVPVKLREPGKLTLNLYLTFNPADQEAGNLDSLLHFVRSYHARSLMLHRLRSQGSESGPEVRLYDRAENAWSVLRNLHDRRNVDSRFDSIIQFMRKAFPSFEGILLEQTGPKSVYASFLEKNRSAPILASGVSDGHLQMLIILTALFSEGGRPAVILLDEPEISLHPWALAVLAEAVQHAAGAANKQVLIATHSPVLISQFSAEESYATFLEDGKTQIKRLADFEGIQDLLDEYAAGSLYMSEMIAAQSGEAVTGGGRE